MIPSVIIREQFYCVDLGVLEIDDHSNNSELIQPTALISNKTSPFLYSYFIKIL